MNTVAFNRHDWTVADVDRVIAMAARGNTARMIATAMQRKELDVIALCPRNGIFVRMRSRLA